MIKFDLKTVGVILGIIAILIFSLDAANNPGELNNSTNSTIPSTVIVEGNNNGTLPVVEDANVTTENITDNGTNNTSVIIGEWNGTSTKSTETFYVPSKEWKVTWNTTESQYGPMNFQIYIYKEDGTLKSVAANVIGANADSSIIRGPGKYYLMINTGQPYEIKVYSV